MSEPTNPLFEEEKAFLERKKLEYERALRGDVAHLKEQTANVGRYALVGGGLAGSLWLITKVLGGRKRNKHREQYADYDHDSDDQDDNYAYSTQYFGDGDFADDDNGHTGYSSGRADYDYDNNGYAADRWQDDAPDYFVDEDDQLPSGQGTVYHSDSDTYDDHRGAVNSDTEDDLDDNGLHDYSDFPAHSSQQHGTQAPDEAAERFESEAYGHPDSTLPFDDSRRLPDSKEFADSAETTGDHKREAKQAAAPSRNLGSMLVSFATSGLGKMVLGQAASIGMALATKVIKSKLAGSDSETTKTSDLAAETDTTDGYSHGRPATPQPDATTAPADSDFDATSRFQDPA